MPASDSSGPSTIGPYRVERELGAGAMGVVHLAHDPRLERRVALKALPEHFADDEERLARFEREARMLAALHHPHVASLHGLEEHDGRRYLVMEYVEGEDLAARIARGALDLEEALELAEQVARGLAAAHDAGIIHRDLKPGNVLVTPDGRAKVVDFGLAKDVAPRAGTGDAAAPRSDEITRLSHASRAASAPPAGPETKAETEHDDEAGESGEDASGGDILGEDTVVQVAGDGRPAGSDLSVGPTVLAPDSGSQDPVATEPGAILGTAAYMSPEQARGRPLDRRTDVWSFGCVLFEMLTRRRPFQGTNLTTTITAVLQTEPDWDLLPARTPPPVRRLLDRCLRKDPRERLRDLGDAALELKELRSGTWSATDWSATDWPDVAPAPSRRELLRTALFALPFVVAVLAAGAFWLGDEAGEAFQGRFEIVLGQSLEVGVPDSVALSPDGRHLAWVSASENPWYLHLRSLDGFESRRLDGTRGGNAAHFSPDGRWIAFFVPQQAAVKKVATDGVGGVQTLSREVPAGSKGLTWVGGETLVISVGFAGGLARLPASGGELETLTEPGPGVKTHRFPNALPGGRHVLFTESDVDVDSFAEARLRVLDLDTLETRTVLEGASDGTFVAATGEHAPEEGDGWLLFVRDGTLFSVPFDLGRLETLGAPARSFPGVLVSSLSGFGVYADGADVLAYAPGDPGFEMNRLVRRGRDGAREVLAAPERPYLFLRVAPDGESVVIHVDSASGDLWTWDLDRGILSRLTTRHDNMLPVWTPDGRVTYASNRGDVAVGLYRQEPGSVAGPELFRRGEFDPEAWTPDGEWLVAATVRPETAYDLVALPAEGGEPRELLSTPAVEFGAEVSVDGWLAYLSNETGTFELYLRPFESPSPRLQVTNGGATDPVFAAGGRELLFRRGRQILAVPFDPAGPTLGSERVVFEDVDLPTGGPPDRKWDLLPDGSLLYPEPIFDPSEVDTLRVVVGFRDELATAADEE